MSQRTELEVRFNRRSAEPTRLGLWRDWLTAYKGIFVILAIVLIPLWYLMNGEWWAIQDKAAAPMHVETARTVNQSYVQGVDGDPSGWMLTVDMNGRQIDAGVQAGPDFDCLTVGSDVSVTYQIGRSGTIYVRSVRAVEPSKSRKLAVSPAHR
jgi:hypothetical protein